MNKLLAIIITILFIPVALILAFWYWIMIHTKYKDYYD